jgi:hypothetical protein
VTRRRTLSALASGLLLAGFASGSTASAGTPKSILHPTLVLGAAVPVGNGVKAGDSGAEWALPGGARLSAEPGAELRVMGAPQKLNLGNGRRVAAYTVVLSSGQVTAHAPTAGGTAVIISAPRKTTVIVSDGEASVAAGAQIAVANAMGSTILGVAGERFHGVEPGMVELVGGGKRPLLKTPILASTASVLLSFGEPVSLGAFSWEAVPGAHAYRVELRDESSQKVVARREMDGTQVPAGFVDLEPGSYSFRLAAVDAVGFESAAPVTRAVRVLGVKVPQGGFLDANGAVRFPPGSRLEFGHQDGVEMTFGTTDGFIPAPPSISLMRTQPSLLRFRAAGGTSVRDLWLLPRLTQAKITFGKRAPKWPGAPLDIAVRVDDTAGNADLIEPTPKVTVGVEPVAVKFIRKGDVWYGAVPSPEGKGPWVVRVEVEDQHGIALGRNFIEVAAAPAPSSGGS